MQQYQTLISDVLNNGVDIYNERTQSICRTLVGAQMVFDLQEGFPAITTRKLPFKSIVGELLGFFRGYQSAADFRALGCRFWDGNANETRAWLDNPFRTGQDDVGHIYGKQWTAWESTQFVKTGERHQAQVSYLTKNGYTSIAEITNTCETHLQGPGTYTVMMKKINQLEEAARKILIDPSDRRIIVTGWNPGEYVRQSLPACHVDYRFIPIEAKSTMSVVMTLRSADTFLGTPANIASTALFLEVMCRLTGYQADKVIIQAANVHLYEGHFAVAKDLVSRAPLQDPKLILSEDVKRIESLDQIAGCFERIEPQHFVLQGYESHGVLSAPMVA